MILNVPEIAVIDSYHKNGLQVLVTDPAILSVGNDDISVAFHVSVRPDDSAQIALLLNKIEGVQKVTIAEVFLFDERSKKMLSGDFAVKAWQRIQDNEVLRHVQQNQIEMSLLIHGEGGNA